NGGLFTLATGRYPAFVHNFAADFVPNAPIVAGNGGILYDLEKEEILSVKILPGSLAPLLSFAFDTLPTVREFCVGGIGESAGDYIRGHLGIPTEDGLFQQYRPIGSAKEILLDLALRKKEYTRVFFVQKPEDTQKNYAALKAQFSKDYTVVTGWECGIEILPKGCGKGEMIGELRRRIGGIHTTVCVGDYENDITMLNMADLGYAVENAPDFVKAHAERIAPSCNHSAIAKIIEELDKTYKAVDI
ncbi:MAG: HAD hydrolase family protein, partial [Oscillospiraceae bacterium]